MSRLTKQAAYSRRTNSATADIGRIPSIKNPERRELCRLDLMRFLVTYFPNSTGMKPFSEDHEKVITRIQLAVLEGGLFAEAVYRGFGKTTILENSGLWAILYGHKKFHVLYGSNANAALQNIESIKMELAANDLLMEDFPEVCHAVAALENKPQRCKSQTSSTQCPLCQGGGECPTCGGLGIIPGTASPTYIEWKADVVVLPVVSGSKASGAIVKALGLTAGSRGLKHKRADGVQQRPDYVGIDDPQTDESARSPMQVSARMDIIKKNILKSGGHRGQISCVMAATVIERDDLVDQTLDPKRNSAWQSERIPICRKFADAHESMWMTEYARIRTTFDPELLGTQNNARVAATEFYRANREAMDKGCEVSWEHCFDETTEISAIQHVYNALIDDGPDVFASEYQNQPLSREYVDKEINRGAILAKTVNITRGIVPKFAEHLTAFIDIQDRILFYAVCAWGPEFRGQLVDYGFMPDQGNYSRLHNVRKTLALRFPGTSREGAIRAGLDALADLLLSARWKREDGPEIAISMCLADAGDGDHADIVYEFCRRSPFGAVVRPSKGRYVGAASVPWEQYIRKAGERLGHHWLEAPLPKSPATRLVHFDANYWKSFLRARLLMAVGQSSSFEMFLADHSLFAEHVMAEYPVKTKGRGREVTEWKTIINRENHFLDCVVGCAVGASMLGVSMIGAAVAPTRRKVKLSELQRERRIA